MSFKESDEYGVYKLDFCSECLYDMNESYTNRHIQRVEEWLQYDMSPGNVIHSIWANANRAHKGAQFGIWLCILGPTSILSATALGYDMLAGFLTVVSGIAALLLFIDIFLNLGFCTNEDMKFENYTDL